VQPAAVVPTSGVEEVEFPAGWEKRYDERTAGVQEDELPDGWEARYDEDSECPYYLNIRLRFSQWDYPEVHRTVAVQEDELPDGWEARHDEDSGCPYYSNKTLGKTQWERPLLVCGSRLQSVCVGQSYFEPRYAQ
jgi:hypothetical protein